MFSLIIITPSIDVIRPDPNQGHSLYDKNLKFQLQTFFLHFGFPFSELSAEEVEDVSFKQVKKKHINSL